MQKILELFTILKGLEILVLKQENDRLTPRIQHCASSSDSTASLESPHVFSISSLTNLALSSPSSLTCGKFLKSSKKMSVIPSMSPGLRSTKENSEWLRNKQEGEKRRRRRNRNKERKFTLELPFSGLEVFLYATARQGYCLKNGPHLGLVL